MDEQIAIRLCLNHQDPTGFEFLFKKYRREAFYHAISILGNQEDAADACQESFSRAFHAIPRLKVLDAFYPWFYRILRNCCLNMIQRKKTATKYRQYQKAQPHLHVDNDHPASLLEKEEEKKMVWDALKHLRMEFREILMMKYIQDYSYEEITEILNIPRGTVMSRLYYARKAFQKVYEDFEEETLKAS